MAAYTDEPMLQLAAAKRNVETAVDERPDAPDADRRDAVIDLTGRRLRVGYVSSDPREHAVGYLMAELFELHDREKVEIFAYYAPSPRRATSTGGSAQRPSTGSPPTESTSWSTSTA